MHELGASEMTAHALLLTGVPGVGKTTIVSKVAAGASRIPNSLAETGAKATLRSADRVTYCGAYESCPPHPASPGRHGHKALSARRRACRDRGDSRAQAVTDCPAPATPAGAELDHGHCQSKSA